MEITKKDLLRPVVGLLAIQPVVIAYLSATEGFEMNSYLSTGWGLQFFITIYLIFFYAWFERSEWFNFDDEDPNESEEDLTEFDSQGSS